MMLKLRPSPFPFFSVYLFPKPGDPGWMRHHTILWYRIRSIVRSPKQLTKAILEAFLWYFFHLWRNVGRCLKGKSSAIAEENGISKMRQFWGLLHIHLCYQIPLASYFRDQLYKPENRHRIQDQLFNNEIPWFHDYTNRRHTAFRRTQRLISDKSTFKALLKQHGIAHAETLGVFDAGGTGSDKNATRETDIMINKLLSQERSVFCKPVSGNQSRDCFKLEYIPSKNTHMVHPIQGMPVEGQTQVRQFLGEALKRPLLVEALLENHHEIQALSESNEITTLRLVTAQFKDGDIRPIYLQIETPLETKEEKGRRFYRIYPIDLSRFEVSQTWKSKTSTLLNYNTDLVLSTVVKDLLRQACELSVSCHRKHIPLNTVAFDLALTEEGPVIIEANYNWSLEQLFMVISDMEEDSLPAQWLREVFEV